MVVRTRYGWPLAALAVGGCIVGGGGSALPRGAPRLADGSTPDPVRFEVVVSGRRTVVRSRVARVLSDSLFHASAADPAAVSAYNLARLIKVRVEVQAAGKDSTRVAITGETYIGDSSRQDSISGLPERWRLITASDPAAYLLRGLARAIRATRSEVAPAGPPSGGATTTAYGPRDPDRGERSGAGALEDSALARTLAGTPVGRSVDVCRSATVPNGWLVLYWYTDSSRCTKLPDERYAGEPNVMRIEREW